MQKIHLRKDIQPLSLFRSKVGTFINQVNKTNRPMVITHHGKTAAVLLNVDLYESLLDELELLKEINQAEREIDSGQVIDHATAKKHILRALKK